jgi:hypothetical protein
VHQQKRVLQQITLVSVPRLRFYLNRFHSPQNASFQSVVRQARQLFARSDDSKLIAELDLLIQNVDSEAENVREQKDIYSVEQHLFDFKIIKKVRAC